jgi:diguanylate cyclase (GGDEF)-like protein/PAS domain S-box-containing protein
VPDTEPHEPPKTALPAAASDPEVVHAYLNGVLSHDIGVMYARSPDDGRILFANAGFEKLVGLPAAQIVGRTSQELFSAEVAAGHRATDELVLRDGRAHTAAETAVDAEGSLRHCVSHKFPLFGPDGAIIAVGGLSVDVTELETERRASRLAQLQAESQFRTVFEHAPIGQVFSNMDGRITAINAPLARMLGYDPAELIGRRALDLVTAEGAVIEEARALRSRAADSISSVRTMLHRDGHEILVRIISALLPGADGEPQWWASMIVDLREEERARVELKRAHAEAVQATDRIRLLHAIATAANEARTLDELAPHVLRLVLAGFDWSQGALAQWTTDEHRAPRLTHVIGSGALAERAELLTPPSGDLPAFCALGDSYAVVVPVAGRRAGPVALVFAGPPETLDAKRLEMLSLVGGECSRVAEREEAARRSRESEHRFRTVFDASPLPMALSLGDTGTYVAVNEALCRLVGRSHDELIGASAREIIHPEDIGLADPAGAAAAAAPDGRHSVEMRLRHANGSDAIANIGLTWMNGPDGTRLLLAQMEDITARRTAENALRHQAERDALTGLANRSHLASVLSQMGSQVTDCALLFIDLDGFKVINDTRGHDVGDEVLVEVAARLRASVRPSDLVCRFGGDEFVVVCRTGSPGDEVGALATARSVADRIEAALAPPIVTRAGTARVTASIGIASSTEVPGAPQDLLQRADTAMYRAKRLGKDRRAVYDAGLHKETVEYQRTAAALRNALAENRFVVHYQPIVRLDDESVVGFEALVRLYDEAGRLVPPDRFIGVAEQSQLIVPMGTWVLQEACRAIARLRRLTGRELVVSVNVAAQQAARSDLACTVTESLADAGLPASALSLELTESALLDADEATLAQLTSLRERGVLIALDDFGTGYSSLTYLRRLPVTQIKVDRSFVNGLTTDNGDAAIVRAVVNLAADLGLFWIAEGVETREQCGALAGFAGHGLAQGYLFSCPVPEEDLLPLLGLTRAQLAS